ncbi:hypothetical protein KR222_011254, partial [Zaprionus bogoriensis]
DVEEAVGFRTASNRKIEISEEQQQQAARLMANLEAYPTQQVEVVSHQPAASECIAFRTASNKVMELTEEMRRKAAQLMADLELEPEPEVAARGNAVPSPNKTAVQEEQEPDKQTEVESEVPAATAARQTKSTTRRSATPLPDNVFETPKCTPELQVSLTQLSERSPLDKLTKSSIITRRNLLSLNKRRKSKRDSENRRHVDASQTPVRQRCAPVTSTPVPARIEGQQAGSALQRERSCSLESPGVQQAARVCGKRRSEEALSPIYAPTHKTRRLGLSRIRNKSSNEI